MTDRLAVSPSQLESGPPRCPHENIVASENAIATPALTPQRSRWYAANFNSGIWRETNATVFEDMDLAWQKTARALNIYEAAGCRATAACVNLIQPVDQPDPHYLMAWDLNNESDVRDALYRSQDDRARTFSITRIPPRLADKYELKERFMDIAAAGALAVKHDMPTTAIRNPYKVAQIGEQVNASTGLRTRLFDVPKHSDRLVAVTSFELDSTTDVVGFSVKGSLPEVKDFVDTIDLMSIAIQSNRVLAQSVDRRLSDSQRYTMERLMAGMYAVWQTPNVALRGKMLL